ncbi:MAG TPA: polysaccharide biosynthesis protein, partial [Candidatus Sericytochromatia bacterium]
AYGSFFKFLYMVIGVPLGFYLMGGNQGHGFQAAIVIIALNDIPFYGAIAYGLWREGLSSVMQDIKATSLFVILLAVMLIGRMMMGLGLPIDGLL